MTTITCPKCGSTNTSITWLPIAGFPNYEISDTGLVRSFARGAERILKAFPCRGYPSVHLSKDGESYSRYVHSLVCEAFHGPRPKGTYATHFPDPTKTNNNASNLEWGTPKKNWADYRKAGINRDCRRKMDADKVRAMRERYKTVKSYEALAREFEIGSDQVRNIVNYVQWKHVD